VTNWYASLMPDNSVGAQVRDVLQRQSSIDAYAPRSIDQLSVNIPIVTALPLGPQDGTEVYLRVGDGNQIAHMLYLASIPGWVQTGLPPVVTTLPTSIAVEGFRVIYDTGTSGVRWDLVYDTSDGTTYPWLFVGGPPLLAEVSTEEGTTSTTYAALATAGPSVTLPLAGDYDVRGGAYVNNDTDSRGAQMSYDIGGTGAVDADIFAYLFQTGATIVSSMSRDMRKTALTAVALTCKYKALVGGTAKFGRRWISATPVRVG
jgi:hypothetical protein